MSYKRPYIESSVFISFIKGEMSGRNRDLDAKAIFEWIIQCAERGDFPITTSTLTIAEVHKRKGSPQMQQAELDEYESIEVISHFQRSYIELVEVDRHIASKAHALCREAARTGPCKLRPNDAIHICSAIEARCDVVLSWDPDILKQQNCGIKVEEPRITGQIALGLGAAK